MSAHKIAYSHEIVLDLTDKKLSQDKINSKLNEVKIKTSYSVKSGIKVGKYFIFLSTSNSNRFRKDKVSAKYLSMNDNLKVDIQESFGGQFKSVRSHLMEDESWFHKYLSSSLSMKELVQVVMFCNRLETLTSFS